MTVFEFLQCQYRISIYNETTNHIYRLETGFKYWKEEEEYEEGNIFPANRNAFSLVRQNWRDKRKAWWTIFDKKEDGYERSGLAAQGTVKLLLSGWLVWFTNESMRC